MRKLTIITMILLMVSVFAFSATFGIQDNIRQEKENLDDFQGKITTFNDQNGDLAPPELQDEFTVIDKCHCIPVNQTLQTTLSKEVVAKNNTIDLHYFLFSQDTQTEEKFGPAVTLIGGVIPEKEKTAQVGHSPPYFAKPNQYYQEEFNSRVNKI